MGGGEGEGIPPRAPQGLHNNGGMHSNKPAMLSLLSALINTCKLALFTGPFLWQQRGHQQGTKATHWGGLGGCGGKRGGYRPEPDQQFAHEWACHLCLPMQEGADEVEIRGRGRRLAGWQAGRLEDPVRSGGS